MIILLNYELYGFFVVFVIFILLYSLVIIDGDINIENEELRRKIEIIMWDKFGVNEL